VPSDDEFKRFTNQLLSHDAMGCVVITIDDIPGWIDNKEKDGSPNEWTRKHLTGLSNYAAQLMEEERLHGFCFIRKFWDSIPWSNRSSLFEPPRVCRRQFGLSYAATAGWSSMA
jgi:hypothetical protein